MKNFNMLMAGTALVVVASPAVANAQGTASAAEATQAAEDTAGVSDIVVTANRREESLQSVPIAVTALSGDMLERSSIVSLRDIAQLSPGLQIMPAFVPGNAIFQIRGQVQTDTSPTIDPSVGVYFDDVYIARSAGSLTNFLDIARVEVLKGPQGTLFGKNTTGGAIRIVSNRPTGDFEGYGKVGYQSYDKGTLEGVINIPLAEGVAFRGAAQYVHKTGGAFTNGVNGKPLDTDKTFFGRGSLLLNPTDRFEVLVQGDYTHVNAGGFGNYLKDFILGNSASTALNNAARIGQPGNIAAGTAALLAEAAAIRANPRTLYADVRAVTATSIIYTPGVAGAPPTLTYVGGEINPYNRYKAYGGAINASYDLGFGTLRSITSLRRVRYDSTYNTDGVGINFINKSRGRVHSNQFSQEVILNGQAIDDRLNWTIGGIYFDEKTTQRDFSSSLIYLQAPAGVAGATTVADSHNESYGFFAQGTFKLTDAFSVTGGVRRSHDNRGFVANAVTNRLNGTEVCSYTAANGLATLPIFTAPCTLSQKTSFNQWSYTASANYQFGQSQLIYIRTGRGYRSGGFNARVGGPDELGAFKPEVVTDYEIGLKADWLDRRLRTNIAVFTSKSSDTQQTLNGQRTPPLTGTFTKTSNIGVRKVHGFEFEMTAVPSDFLSFDSSVAYTEGSLANPSVPDVKYLNDTPKWTVGVGATLKAPIGETLEANLRLDASYRDKMYSANVLRGPAPAGSPAGTLGPILYIPSYRDRTLLNARLTLTHSPTGIELSVFGTNLSNQFYEARSLGIGGLGNAVSTYGEPRVFGAELKVPFGPSVGR
ncbi:TonB-dependent receptor [Novosphingobium sp. G106]|uniref:TonB-dependent receptor n=1 Tax=Novosphingobium sp. G106 TaxID=2849500 RepID=UPI001C2DF10E|nr:TonB-dependent receptor [Novosphingobium sp. G106]MBV1688972.1 TonB-dependent receptor [Novosphingobium sp. G106]